MILETEIQTTKGTKFYERTSALHKSRKIYYVFLDYFKILINFARFAAHFSNQFSVDRAVIGMSASGRGVTAGLDVPSG